MAFDGIITRAAAEELSRVLTGGRIDKIYEPEPDSVVLNIRTARQTAADSQAWHGSLADSVKTATDDQAKSMTLSDLSQERYGSPGVVRLFASCHSAGASVRLIERSPENPKEPYPFCMLLRKHIQGSKIVSVEQRGAERIIELTMERLNELGLMVTKKLIFEIMGKYSNIILVDMSRKTAKPGHDSSAAAGIDPYFLSESQDDAGSVTYDKGAAGCMILGSIKGVPSGLSRVREVLPGRLYEYPPEQDKIPFDKATASDFTCKHDDATIEQLRHSEQLDGSDAAADLLEQVGRLAGNDEVTDQSEQPGRPAASTAGRAPEEAEARSVNASRELLKKIGGISPSVADELALLKSGEERKARIDETLAAITSGALIPRVYEDDDGVPKEFHIMELSEYQSLNEIRFDTLSACMDYYFQHREQTNRIVQRSNELMRPVQAALQKLELKKQRLLEDMLRAEDSEKLRLYGELLTANMSMLTQGASEVTVTSYYDGSEVTIPLDPRWSPSRNAQSYYKRYAKSRTALKEKKVQLDDTNENIEYLESCLSFIENAGSISELEDLRAELEESGFIKRRRAAGRKPPRFKASPREYETTDGFTVLIGRNNRENDVLTLEIASRGDYWLHTKDIPGSHVILRTEGREPGEAAILEAARLAALYSKAKNSGNVPVDYVPVRYVKKPSGAKPGKVIFTHNRTVYVDPGEPGKGRH